MTDFPHGAELVAWLEKESRLPGQRPHLELLLSFSQNASPDAIATCRSVMEQPIKADTPREFVAMCAVVGSGHLTARNSFDGTAFLRQAANYPTPRVRDAASMGLLEIGKADTNALWNLVLSWENPTLAEKRVLVGTLCDEALLKDQPDLVRKVLALCDEFLEEMDRARDTKSEDFKALRKSLGFALFIPVTLLPEDGKPFFEKWTQLPSPDVRWALNENLKKSRMVKMDADWVQQQIEFLNDAD